MKKTASRQPFSVCSAAAFIAAVLIVKLIVFFVGLIVGLVCFVVVFIIGITVGIAVPVLDIIIRHCAIPPFFMLIFPQYLYIIQSLKKT